MPERVLPPMLGIPRLLDAAGALRIDPSLVAEDQRNAGRVLYPANDGDFLRKLAQAAGLAPTPGETLGHFWEAQTPNTLPPSIANAGPEQHDIELQPENKSASMAGLRRAVGR